MRPVEWGEDLQFGGTIAQPDSSENYGVFCSLDHDNRIEGASTVWICAFP